MSITIAHRLFFKARPDEAPALSEISASAHASFPPAPARAHPPAICKNLFRLIFIFRSAELFPDRYDNPCNRAPARLHTNGNGHKTFLWIHGIGLSTFRSVTRDRMFHRMRHSSGYLFSLYPHAIAGAVACASFSYMPSTPRIAFPFSAAGRRASSRFARQPDYT